MTPIHEARNTGKVLWENGVSMYDALNIADSLAFFKYRKKRARRWKSLYEFHIMVGWVDRNSMNKYGPDSFDQMPTLEEEMDMLGLKELLEG